MTKVVSIDLLNEVECVIRGLNDDDYAYFEKKFSIFANGYFFSKKFKLGVWDGKVKFFHNKGKTYINLLDEILPDLRKFGYTLKIGKDNRAKVKLSVPEIDKDYFKEYGITLADHQVNTINALTKNKGGIAVSCTASGKSYVNAALCKIYSESLGFKMIVIVPTEDLVMQGIIDFANVGIKAGEYSGSTKNTNPQIVVSTWQALQNAPEIMTMFNGVVVDECHGTRGEVLRKLLNEYGNKKLLIRIGVTGSLPTELIDRICVKITLGQPQINVTAKELIASGWLATPSIQMIELQENLTKEYEQYKKQFPEESKDVSYAKFVSSAFPDYSSEKAHLSKNELRNNYIANFVSRNRLMEKSNSLILVNTIKQGEQIAKFIDGAIFVHSSEKAKDRKTIYDTFRDNDDVVVIATSQLASTGINIPRIFNLYFIDMGKSYIRAIQSVGRGLRKAVDKDTVNIFDITSNLKYNKKHSSVRKKFYDQAGYGYKFRKERYADDGVKF